MTPGKLTVLYLVCITNAGTYSLIMLVQIQCNSVVMVPYQHPVCQDLNNYIKHTDMALLYLLFILYLNLYGTHKKWKSHHLNILGTIYKLSAVKHNKKI